MALIRKFAPHLALAWALYLVVLPCWTSVQAAGWYIDHPLEGDNFPYAIDIDTQGRGRSGNLAYVVRLKRPDDTIAKTEDGFTPNMAPYQWTEQFNAPSGGWTPVGDNWKFELVAQGQIEGTVNIDMVNP